MANKSNNYGKNFWAFIAVVVGGLAYLAAFLFVQFGASNLARVGSWVAAVCGLIAWVIVFVLGWKRVRENNVWMLVVYIAAMLMIIVFAFLPIIL